MTFNSTTDTVTEFILVGFSGFQLWQHWLSIPLSLLLVLAVMGNITLVLTIYREHCLHEPMCFFLCYLSIVDLHLSLTTTPKLLTVLWFDARSISRTSCFTQMFFVHVFFLAESGILAAMAFDRYVAICRPLRYMSILNNRLVLKMMAAITARSIIFTFPVPLLAARLHYCLSNIIEYPYCNNLAVIKLSCDNNISSSMYQMVAGFVILLGDLMMIFLSYFLIIYAVLKLRAQGAARKAFSTCSSHLIIILISYSSIVVISIRNNSDNRIVTYILVLFNVLLLNVPPALNPLVYGVRNKEINEGIRKHFFNTGGA